MPSQLVVSHLPAPNPPYDDNHVRRAVVQRIHDGDTVALDIDLGFYTHEYMSCRLAGINAIELANPGGIEARDHLMSMLAVGQTIRVVSISTDKYAGRFDGVLYRLDGLCLNDQMVLDGYAALWDGKGSPAPVPAWPIG